MRRITYLVAAIVTLCIAGTAPAKEKSPGSEKGKLLVIKLTSGLFDAVIAEFDAKMKQALPLDKLKKTWAAVEGNAGKFKKIIEAKSGPYQHYRITLVTCQFEKGKVNIQWVFDTANKVAGLTFLPAK